jgi:hypothetical protein
VGIIDRFFKRKPHSEVIGDVVDNLRHLAECELAVSDFYKLCGEAMKDESDFWAELADAEALHADHIKKMLRFIEASPEEYSPGHTYSPASIRTFRLQMDGLLDSLKAGRTPTDRLFAIATEIENSAVELNFVEIVKTGNAEYNALARQIAKDCQAHRDSLKKKSAK